MSKKQSNSGGSPYKVLYWMGAGVAVLLLGIVALVMLQPSEPHISPDPERTLLWIYDAGSPGGPAALAVIEESRSRGTLTALPFPASEEARQVFATEKSSHKTKEHVEAKLGRQIHHRVFLPYSVVGTLIDAAGGITVEGWPQKGAEAVAYIKEGGDLSARRATVVMLALSEAVTTRGVSMGVSEGLALARQVDTDLDLMNIPNVLGRWSGYASKVETPANADPASLQKLLLPDPAPETPKK